MRFRTKSVRSEDTWIKHVSRCVSIREFCRWFHSDCLFWRTSWLLSDLQDPEVCSFLLASLTPWPMLPSRKWGLVLVEAFTRSCESETSGDVLWKYDETHDSAWNAVLTGLLLCFLGLFFFLCFCSLQETYEAKRNEFLGELQKKEDEMRQMFVMRVKEKEAELKEAEKDVSIL